MAAEDKINEIIVKHWGLKGINLSVLADDIQKLLNEERESIRLETVVSKPKWEPWITYKNMVTASLPIIEPPCKHCKLWNPQPKFMNLRTGLLFDGVVCCHAEEQHQDFSCYKQKE